MEKEWNYKQVLQELNKLEMLPPKVHQIIETIQLNGFDREALEQTLANQGVANLWYHSDDFLDLMILYVQVIINDHIISEREYEEFGLLKLLFKIKEGDFYSKRLYKIKMLIFQHLDQILQDGKISIDESFTTANLQSMFGLSAEQYFNIREEYSLNK